MGLPVSAFPMDLPSPGLMPIPDVSQPPQPLTGASGKPFQGPVFHTAPYSIVRTNCSVQRPHEILPVAASAHCPDGTMKT